jgi:hypothetical protein
VSSEKQPRLKQSFGASTYSKTSPPLGRVSPATKILNIVVPFEEALKLGLAIDQCVRRLNSYNRSTRAGKRSALTVAVHFNSQRITVHEGRL